MPTIIHRSNIFKTFHIWKAHATNNEILIVISFIRSRMELVILGASLDKKVILTRPVPGLGAVVEPVVELEHEIPHVVFLELSVNVFNHQRLPTYIRENRGLIFVRSFKSPKC
jgi:hypothetical protein